ncbi:MAG: excinuclease ABC subunit UvrA [Bacteroidetes bacterium]|nr:excinuclease ABC subunit UvrA [Bacteroidota bacterium]
MPVKPSPPTKVSKPLITVHGARLHNLKNLNVSIEQGSFTVVTGVSGSGKSSLVFDTLFAEGQRRYVESLSAYARQFLGRMKKPEVDYIHGLCPAVAVEQKVITRNPRSTVATTTEIYDYLKLLFSRAGHTISPISGREVKRHTPEDVVQFILSMKEQEPVLILAPLEPARADLKGLELIMQNGFTRVLCSDSLHKIEDILEAKKLPGKNLMLVVDRIFPDPSDEELASRAADSAETAFWEGHGTCYLKIGSETTLESFTNRFELDGMSFELPSRDFLSFNNPVGACRRCEGFGMVLGIDEDLVIPDKSLSVYDDCVAPWRGETLQDWKHEFIRQASKAGFPIHRAYEDLNAEERKFLWEGKGKLSGINDFFTYLEEKSYKIQYRVLASRYRGKTLCPDCRGTRLRPDAAYVKLVVMNPGEHMPLHVSISDVLLMTVDEALAYFQQLQLSEHDTGIARRILTEIRARLGYLSEVGLGYLSLNRLSNTLSGGESQRINLATSLGSSLTGSMYILDEPSIGLHPRDTERLIGVLKALKKEGNTVIVVEHDEDVMRASDQIVDIGPEAGRLGGELVYSGRIDEITNSERSLTAAYLKGDLNIEVPAARRPWSNSIHIKGARENNLKNLDVQIPLGVFTAVTGVSGSGKTSLVTTVLFPALARATGQFTTARAGKLDKLEGDLHLVKAVEMVDQNPIGRSSRSNPITYIKAYDDIRELFAGQPLSKFNGFKPQHFSFNVDGGRCDACQGEGEITVEMQFMADIHLPCESCNGKRFKPEVLEVEYKGKSIHDVLELTIDEAMQFFADQKNIQERIRPLQDVGLGYVTLGQSSNTLSGGEAQRVKLAYYLGKSNPHKGKPTVFIFDEPTTGLHFHDIQKLLKSFRALIAEGHTLVVIEHNLDMIKCADWVIDLGPDAGAQGGQLVFAGTPEGLAACPESLTGRFLKPRL